MRAIARMHAALASRNPTEPDRRHRAGRHGI